MDFPASYLVPGDVIMILQDGCHGLWCCPIYW